MATLATQPIASTGTAPSFAAATSGGDKAHVGDHVYLVVKNGGGSPITVTLATSATEDGFAVADNAVSVAAGAETYVGPLEASLYADTTDGLCHITYSGVTTVTVAALQF